MSTQPNNYANEASFKVFVDYLALKRHFTSDGYDYHKYNGKTSASFQKFKQRNDTFFFYKLSKKRDWHNILLSNLVENPNLWIRDLCEDRAEVKFIEWKKRVDSLSYHFETQLDNILPVLEENFRIKSGAHPHLIHLYMRKQISREFFTIITHLTNVFPYWQETFQYDIVIADLIKISQKYFSFLEIDKKKFAVILKSSLARR